MSDEDVKVQLDHVNIGGVRGTDSVVDAVDN